MTIIRPVFALVFGACVCGSSCQPDDALLLPERRQAVSEQAGLELLARFVHLTDTHVVDEESPARLAGSYELVPVAWRSWESYSTQLLDGVIRTANRIHASGRPIDFLVHTGDVCDNAQGNELDWFMTVMEGGEVNPLSGFDDRPLAARPEPNLDAHAPFVAQGLYQQGVHGDLPSIPWYVLAGNHDVYSVGVFAIFGLADDTRVAPMPLQPRPGLFLPTLLNPTSAFTHGKVTPNMPGPPELFTWPLPVWPVAERAYFDRDEFIATMHASRTTPAGHGFIAEGRSWYSVSPAPGLRLIGLFTSDQIDPAPGIPLHEGSISVEQLEWLESELEAATARGELIVVATHHPSSMLETLYGTAADPDQFRQLLNMHPAVVLHLAGHLHRNRVADRGNYIEIETCGTLDWPQEARLVELWREVETGSVFIGYEMFSHVEEELPGLGEDSLLEMRKQARALAKLGYSTPEQRTVEQVGTPSDRMGWIELNR